MPYWSQPLRDERNAMSDVEARHPTCRSSPARRDRGSTILPVALVALLAACSPSSDSAAEHHAQQRVEAAQFEARNAALKDSTSGESQPDSSADAAVGQHDVRRLTMTVYKTPTCECCSGWVDHARSQGFRVVTRDLHDVAPIKTQKGVPEALWSCHTATIGDYVIEGHVPAADIRRLLAERPKVVGLAVPGMPIGSPGMEIPGVAAEPYEVLSFDASGNIRTFAKH